MKGRRPGTEERGVRKKRETETRTAGEGWKEAAGQMTGENNLCSTTAGKQHIQQQSAPQAPASLFYHSIQHTHTWSTVVLLHPDVAVALGNAGLGVQEGEPHGPLSAQTGIVAATVFNGLFVEFLTET